MVFLLTLTVSFIIALSQGSWCECWTLSLVTSSLTAVPRLEARRCTPRAEWQGGGATRRQQRCDQRMDPQMAAARGEGRQTVVPLLLSGGVVDLFSLKKAAHRHEPVQRRLNSL